MTSRSTGCNDEDAAAWVARMDNGRWTDADEDELQLWLDADPARAGLLLRTQAIWASFDQTAVEHGTTDTIPLNSSFRPTRRWLLGGGGAMAATIAAGIFWQSGKLSYETTIGEIRRLPLQDGSVATINTMSSITVKLAGSSREVWIDRGEAWFEVSKDPARPFTVTAGAVRAVAIGTAFSVRKRDRGADIIVTEGVVEIGIRGKTPSRLRLAAGNGAYVGNDASISFFTSDSLDRALAWREGKIELLGTTVSEAAEEFNRYNRRQIKIAETRLRIEALDGIFRIDDPEGFARAVQTSLNSSADFTDPNQITLGSVQSPARP